MASTTDWAPFFVAASGVLAALAGLLFVAISINLDHIVEAGFDVVGLQTLTTLILPLILCLSVLMPALSTTAFTWELVASIALLLVLLIRTAVRMVRVMSRVPFFSKTANDVVTIAMLIGTALAADRAASLTWLAASVLVFILVASLNAWALLVLIELDNPARRRTR